MTRLHERWCRLVKEVGGSSESDRSGIGTGKEASGAGRETEMPEVDAWAHGLYWLPVGAIDDDEYSFGDTFVYCLIM